MAEIKTPAYWVFVCNPKKWAIDRFLERRITQDTWGIRPSDRELFSPGQLGIVRVGVDQRNKAQRKGKPRLKAGIYALCEVESDVFPGTGARDEFWAPGQERSSGWPTVKIRYLRAYADTPLTIERLRRERPSISNLLLKGFQASSFPISSDDFHAVLELLDEDVDALPFEPRPALISPAKIAELEKKYQNASPEVRQQVSRRIERGPIGAHVKRANRFKCQLCEAMDLEPLGFTKRSGEPYVEAHHVMPVSKKEIGSLSASNILTLCANHHREIHYGRVDTAIGEKTFDIIIGGRTIKIPRFVYKRSK